MAAHEAAWRKRPGLVRWVLKFAEQQQWPEPGERAAQMIKGASLVDGFDEPEAPDYGAPGSMQGDDPVEETMKSSKGAGQQDEVKPMFTLDPIKYQPKGLLRLQASNDIITMALDNNHVIRVNLRNPQDLDDIEISRKPEDSIHRIFLDPTGSHLIIAMTTQESYYLHISWKKPKPLAKMKGIVLESVAWDKANTDTTNTGSILIGTRNGQIFETWIEAKDKLFADSKEKFFRPLFHTNEDRPISGLRMERFPSANPADPPKYFVMATTANRIYQFIGGPTLEMMFQPYESNPGFHEVPGNLSYSELQFMGPQQGLAKSFSWLTGPGIYFGGLVFGSQNPGDNVMTDTSLLAYPSRKLASAAPGPGAATSGAKDATSAPAAPIGLAMTEFHFLVLFDDRIQAISRLNDELVWEETWPANSSRIGRLRGLTFDAITNTLWLYSDRLVWMILIVEEDRKVWEAYLRKGMYETALSYCKTLQQKDYVWSTQAEHYFSQGSYALAATYYSKTKRSFEEVCLKFLAINERDALKTYLLHKLEHLAPSDAMQITVVCTWLVELYLNKLDQLKEGGPETLEAQKACTEEFKQFLSENKDNNRLDHATTYTLIASHGHIDVLLYYATQVEDFERVISHHIQQGEFGKALSAMSRQTAAEVYYKFSPILMFVAPFHTVNAWIRASKILEPKKLIPSLMRYSIDRNPPNEKANQAIRYLQYCVNELNNQDPAIHNFLLSLYAKEEDDTELLRFLAKENASYDLKYALRLCTKEQKHRACVHIYGRMALYEEAVDLALRVDLDLAKLYADKPDQADDQELRKKLWLRIARHVVEYGKDIKTAMQFLTHCELLKIEDILPFFPDFVLIDDFKEAICSSLTNYNHNIEELKVDMDDATKSANLIRADIIELRNKHGMVGGSQKCDLCSFPAISRAFYLFPCQHLFHHDCLLRDVIPRLSNIDKQRVGELQQRLANPSLASPAPPGKQRANNTEEIISTAQLDQIKNELDDVIARECLFCGEAMIASIDQPFEADSSSSIRLD